MKLSLLINFKRKTSSETKLNSINSNSNRKSWLFLKMTMMIRKQLRMMSNEKGLIAGKGSNSRRMPMITISRHQFKKAKG